MHDADAGRNDPKAVESLRSPFEKLIALAIASELTLDISREGVRGAREVHLDGVVDDQVDGHERLYERGRPARSSGGGAHRGEIDEQGNAGEVLEQDARDDEWDFRRAFGIRFPLRKRPHVLLGDADAIQVAEDRFKNQTEAYWQPRHAAQTRLIQPRQ